MKAFFRRKTSILSQVASLFLISILVVGMITWFSQEADTDNKIMKQMEDTAKSVAYEVMLAVKEYPRYKWLLRYWYEHSDEMDIEYDVEFTPDTETARKTALFEEHNPGVDMRYAVDLEALSEEDQKLYAEVAYSWMITRVNEIRRAYPIDFLYCIVTDKDYLSQFFLFSAAGRNQERGDEYEQVYRLGKTVEVEEGSDLQEGMRVAQKYASYLANTGKYVDYYIYLDSIGQCPVLIGLTYNQSELLDYIHQEAVRDTQLAVLQQVILSALCLFLIWFFILRPLRHVQGDIRTYTETKDSSAIRYKPLLRNEIGELSDDVVGMAREIDDYVNRIESITAEKERISAELELASSIQMHMLPSTFPAFPDRTDFDVYASMKPAKEVGGDFYDFQLIDDDHLALVIGDVSGKGVPAALVMMGTDILFRSLIHTYKDPAMVLERMNNAIFNHNKEEMFVTIWLGVLELSTGTLTAANAGHEYPAWKKADGSFALIKDKHGVVIGAIENMKYKDYTLQLQHGDKFFVYTDGVPEATNADLQLFKNDRMLAALQSAEDGTPHEILDAVSAAVQEFTGEAPQFDDITMICVEYK
ncbi:MAG: PP2C family protein-serine/threonine phosphatase [Clostridiales bacterium]|nr:PP2C family protein-serine/threonine phosphatase [Clostridiales bacterium]